MITITVYHHAGPTGYTPRRMTRLQSKFKTNLDALTAAAAGEVDLRDNYKLYQKVQRFYTKEGIQFTGDASTDYDILINYLSEDLFQ